jgi:hypothetical protein
MNISIRSNTNVQQINQMKSMTSNSNNSPANLLNKQKEAIKNQIKEVSENKELSSTEKSQKINDLNKQMDQLDIEIGKQKLEDIKNSGNELAKNMAEKAEKSTTNEEKKENASVALNYSLISASEDNKDIRALNGYRKVAMREEGPDSNRVKRIDDMISDKQKNVSANLVNMAKAIEEYSKSNKKELENKIKEKIEKADNNAATQETTENDNPSGLSTSNDTANSKKTSQEINSEVKVNTTLAKDNNNNNNNNVVNTSRSSNEQQKSENKPRLSSIDTRA